MTVRELAEECGKRNVECKECPYYGKECEIFTKELDGISPHGILAILDEDIKTLGSGE